MIEPSCEWERVGRELGTDKAIHTYLPTYERLLGRNSALPQRILELGVLHGNSLSFWLKMFPTSEIHGLDLFSECKVTDPRLTVHQGFQQDPSIALLFGNDYFDVIIDDCGHRAEWQRASVQILWPCLKEGGLYFIEDILTDEYPDEFNRWQGDPDYLYGECNKRNANEAYDRADALVVLKKTINWRRHPLADDPCLRHPRWPAFFRLMEGQATPPFTGRSDGNPSVYWGWLEKDVWWRPLWEAFKK